jgi:catecholate siderophore receptor
MENTKPVASRIRNRHVSTLALANVIMLAGASKAADIVPPPDASPAPSAPKTTPASPVKRPDAAAKSGATATAKSSSSTAEPSTTLDEVVVTAASEPSSYQTVNSANGKYTSPLLDTAQTVTVVPLQLMQDQHATSLRDVLQNVPGITFGAGEGGTFAGDNLTIRGFNAQEDIFVDGFRDTGVYNRDPFNLQQVEVVKGPASAYSGHGSTGGYVNLISKAPSLDPHYEFNTGYGTNQYYRETLDINQPLTGVLPDAAFRLNAVYQYNNFANLDDIYNSRWGANPVFSFGLGTDTVVTAGYLFLQEQDLPSFGLPVVNAAAVASNPSLAGSLNHVAPVDYSNFYGFVNRDYENTTTQIPTLNVVHVFDDNFKIENTARYEYTLRQSLATPPRFDAITGIAPQYLPPNYTTSLPNGNPPAGLVTRELRDRHQLDTLAGDQLEFTSKFKTWKFEHTLVTDAEYSHQEEDFRTFNGVNVATPLYAPQPFNSYPFPTDNLGPETRSALDDASFSLFDSIKLTDQWILSGGMRYDHLEENSHIDATPAAGATAAIPVQSLHRADDLASWRAALNYKPLPNGSIYFGYGTSYNPSIEGGQDSASPDALATNTIGLPPEENDTYEFGTKWDLLDEKLSLTGAIFQTEKTNARITDPSSPAGTTVFALAGKQRVQGAEIGVQGNLTKDWKVFGGYSYLQSKIVSGPPSSFPGNKLPNTPNQTFNLWTTYELPIHLTLGGGVNFIDKRYGSVNNTAVADGYWTGQLMASYKVNEHLNMQVNVYNLWDTEFIEAVGSNFTPGAGRSVVVSAEVEF